MLPLEEFVSAWVAFVLYIHIRSSNFTHKIGKLFVSCYNFSIDTDGFYEERGNLMETIICGHCGAPVFYDDGLGYGVCEYCGSIIKDREDAGENRTNLDREVSYIMEVKPYAWEYKLLFAVLDSGLQKAGSLKQEMFRPLLLTDEAAKEEILRYVKWITGKLEKLQEYTEPLHRIFKVELPEAMGPPGQPGDETKLVNTANRIGSVYTGLIYWGLEFQVDATPINLKGLALEVRGMAGSILENMEHFCYQGRNHFAGLQPGMKVPKDTSLVLRELKMEQFMGELKKLGVL